MKRYIPIHTQGWIPQDPYIPRHLKIASNRHRQISKAKTVAGSTLLLIGLIALVISIAAVQQSRQIWSQSYVLNPDQKSDQSFTSGGHYTLDPFYNNHSFEGQIIVEGENVKFKVISEDQKGVTWEHNGKKVNCTVNSNDPQDIHQVISTTVDGSYKFNLPANGDYSYGYVLQNNGSQQARVTFQLNDTQTAIGMLIPGAIALLATALPGTVLIISGRKGKKQLASMPLK